MIDEAGGHLAQMRDAASEIGDRRLQARVESGSEASVRRLFDRVRDNPAGLAPARRYLVIYLSGRA